MDIVNRFTGKVILKIEKLKRADLSGANLSGANLSRANLSEADLNGADLYRADLYRANLYRANLYRADLYRANLSGANLSGANLSGANLSRANLSEANLSGADLSGVNLSEANLSRANLSGADLSGVKNYYPQLYCLKQMPSDTKLTLYKYVNKDFKSPTSVKKITYKVVEKYTEDNFNSDERETCGPGLSVASLQWCLINKNKEDIILECSFIVKDIIAIPFATDGKIRVREIDIVRKLNEEDINKLLNSCN